MAGFPLLARIGGYFLSCVTACSAELFDHPPDEFRRSWRSIDMLVVKLHRLPLKLAELMEWLDLDPLDVLHGGDKPGNLLDIGGIVGQTGHQREAHPCRLAHRSQSLRETQSRSQVAPSRHAVGIGVTAFDIEQRQIEIGQELLVGTSAEK